MKERNPGIDLLRMAAMWMVVILHVLNKGGVLEATVPLSAGRETARLLELGAYCAVNCYALISGYVGVQRRFHYGSAIALWLRVVFYTLGVTAVFAIFRPETVTANRWLRAVFPVLFRQYWYVTAYFGMCLFIPFFNHLLRSLTRHQARVLAASLILVFSILPTLRQKDVFLTDNGYSVLWISCLYLLGGILKLHGPAPQGKCRRWAAVYVLCVLITWGVKLAGDRLWMLRQGTVCDRVLLSTYTSPTILLVAVALVLCFAGLRIPAAAGQWIQKASALAFSVYLIHAHPLIWEYWLSGRFAPLAAKTPPVLAAEVLGTAILIYAACSVLDLARDALFRALSVSRRCRSGTDKLAARLNGYLERE